MKTLALLFIAVSACFGSEISGVWRLQRAAAEGPSIPIAVQVEQWGDRVQVVKIISTTHGKRVEQLWLTSAAIHTVEKAIEITVAGETWIIGARGELTIREASGQRVVLEAAEGVVQ